MKIEGDFLYINETYILENKDIFKVERLGKKTNVYINDKKIPFIENIEYIQEGMQETKIKIKRIFNQSDFKNIEPIYKKKGEN